MFTFVIFSPVPLHGIGISPQKGSSGLTGRASTDKPYQTLHVPPNTVSVGAAGRGVQKAERWPGVCH